ncbi:MAG TPA: hypothetical protein DIW81_16400 [Planctomycetaceae bacterium]|nr:hypothetical protein [Rubinisphaera sp.]HCS53149.1 hypothetical protein [Planctomycetaceae bacterium]|tara:strand:+ start:462 stop:680 length:219 start_codon:yes stop_codon:yes gene_type:complete
MALNICLVPSLISPIIRDDHQLSYSPVGSVTIKIMRAHSFFVSGFVLCYASGRIAYFEFVSSVFIGRKGLRR